VLVEYVAVLFILLVVEILLVGTVVFVNALFVLLLEGIDGGDAERHCEYEELMKIHVEFIQYVDPDQFSPPH